MVLRPAGVTVKDDERDELDVEIPKEQFEKLESFVEEERCLELKNERDLLKNMLPLYQKRREFLKTVPKFWPAALMRYPTFAMHVQHEKDQEALMHLEDLWVERDPKETRVFTLEFHFSENKFFNDKVLKKVYKLAQKESKPDDDKEVFYGITKKELDFNWNEDVEIEATTISWKHDLTKEFPRLTEDDDVAEAGSFFNFFTHDDDPFDIGLMLAHELWPKAIEFAIGKEPEDDDDMDEDEDSEDEEDDDEAEEIDLEKPEKKRKRRE